MNDFSYHFLHCDLIHNGNVTPQNSNVLKSSFVWQSMKQFQPTHNATSHFLYFDLPFCTMPLTQNVTWSLGAVAQPVYVVAWNESAVVRSKTRLPTGLDGCGLWPAHAIRGQSKICMWDFCSQHMKIEGCNCWELPGPTGGKRASLSTSMFDG
jgi:hypothetical protein